MDLWKNSIITQERYYLIKDFGSFNDFGKLLQCIPHEQIRFRLRRFFKSLRENLKNFRKTFPRPCRMSVCYLRKILRHVLPFQIFGSMCNFSKFMKIIVKLCTASKYEMVRFQEFTNWRYKDVKWLPECEDKEIILANVQVWLIHWITINILRNLFCIQIDTKTNKVLYTPRKYYQSLYDKAISGMEKNKQLLPCEQNPEQPTTTRLVIVPKDDAFKYRPLVITDLLKDKKDIIKKIRIAGETFERKLFKAWNTFLYNNKNKKIYGIKMDLKDAFSNANMDVIFSLLKKYLRNSDSIINALKNQPILCRSSKTYVWNRGLMQGMVASEALCHIDRCDFDNKNLSHYMTNESFFHRTVDDYFYCSTNMDDVNGFAKVLIENCKLNENKTENNFIITYMGRLFDIDFKQVGIKIAKIDTCRSMSKLYYTQFDEPDPFKYLFNICIFRCNAFYFNKILLNLSYNTHEMLLMNYFKAMIIVAFKVDCAIKIRWHRPPRNLPHFIEGLSKYYAQRVRRVILRYKPIKTKFGITRKLLRVICYQAFIVVLKQRCALYNFVIRELKNYVRAYKCEFLGEIRNLKLPKEFENIYLKRVSPFYA